MVPLERGLRSTLWRRPDGTTARQYNDTGAWADGGGAAAAGAAAAPPSPPEPLYAGGAAPRAAAAPPHLRAALRHLAHGPRAIEELAFACAVAPSTAWSYATRAVEAWPAAAPLALRLVHPPVVAALRALDDRRGALTALLDRAEATAALRGDVAWRCLPDRYAHLRLARVCLQVMGE